MSVSSTRPDRQHLKKFGLTVSTGFTLIGGLSWWRGHTIPPVVLWTLATLLVVPALIAPTVLGPVERAWLTLGGWLAWVNTRIILTILFYAVVTPAGAVMRLFRDPLDRRLHEAKKSYWIQRAPAPRTAPSPPLPRDNRFPSWRVPTDNRWETRGAGSRSRPPATSLAG
jgi:hypothetical protein